MLSEVRLTKFSGIMWSGVGAPGNAAKAAVPKRIDWFAVVPGAIRSALPGHDPRREADPQWVQDWIAGYAAVPSDYVPMLDTSHPEIPVPFPPHAA